MAACSLSLVPDVICVRLVPSSATVYTSRLPAPPESCRSIRITGGAVTCTLSDADALPSRPVNITDPVSANVATPAAEMVAADAGCADQVTDAGATAVPPRRKVNITDAPRSAKPVTVIRSASAVGALWHAVSTAQAMITGTTTARHRAGRRPARYRDSVFRTPAARASVCRQASAIRTVTACRAIPLRCPPRCRDSWPRSRRRFGTATRPAPAC